ncbi:MAG: hypothetical protein AB7S78_03795 [Candidatus Omnitrophota bacterium]
MEMNNEQFDHQAERSPKHSHHQFPHHITKINESIAVYTVLSILVKMRHQLGLEAMMEYLDHYLRVIEQHNPKLKYAVSRALTMMNIQKMYDQAVTE